MSGRRAAPGGFDADRRSGASGDVPVAVPAQVPAPGSRRAARLAEQAAAAALTEPVVEVPVAEPVAVPAAEAVEPVVEPVVDPEPVVAPSARPRRRRRLRVGLLLLSLQLASIAYLSSVGGLLWWSHAPMLVGWQPKVVLTGSMLPVIRPGDVALVGPADPHDQFLLPPGRIVLVEDRARESGTYLHRIVRYEDNGFLVTKGDANPTEDHPAVDPARVRGQVRLLVPAIGRPVVWVHDHRYTALGVSLGLTWAAIAFALAARGRAEEDGETDDAGAVGDAVAGAPPTTPTVVPSAAPPAGRRAASTTAAQAVPAQRVADGGPTLLPSDQPLPSRILSHRTLGGPPPAAPAGPSASDAGPSASDDPGAFTTPELPATAETADAVATAQSAEATESARAPRTPATPESPEAGAPGRFAQALGRPSVEEVLTVMAARPPGEVVLPDVAGPDALLPQLGLADPAPDVPVPPSTPADAAPPVVLSADAERLVLDLDAFEAAFGAAFGADDDEDVSGFDGRGFDL